MTKRPKVKRKSYVYCTPILLIALILVALQNCSTLIREGHAYTSVDQDRYLSSEEKINGDESHHKELHPGGRKLNILTLGGSVTWGAVIENVTDAWPYQLRSRYDMEVTNLAIRGTGSFYPAQCITSMLRDNGNDDTVSFDVIILEFSINGMHGFPLLFERLQVRYPNALFIYVDIFSMKSGQFDSKEARKTVLDGGGYVYHFPNKGDPTAQFDYHDALSETRNLLSETGSLFADDNHHLNPHGHSLIAEQVMEIMIKKVKFSQEPPEVGSWLGGDECISWYETGELPPTSEIIDGGVLNQWDESKNKWAIEVQPDGMIMRYEHESDKDAPFQLQHMTKCVDKNDPYTSKYPPVIVRVERDLPSIEKAKEQAMNGEVEVKRHDYEVLDSISEGWTFVSNLHRKQRGFHITSITHIGTFKPGTNYIFVYPIEERDEDGNFRVTATIICEACGRLGWNSDVW